MSQPRGSDVPSFPDRLQRLWWQRPRSQRAAMPLKGLTDNPAFQWWRDATILQPDSWWGEAQTAESLTAQADLMRELGTAMFRFEVLWRAVAPVRPGGAAYDPYTASQPDWSGYDWRRLDLILDVLQAASIAPLPVVDHAPGWAMDTRVNSPAAPPAERAYYADLMTALARRYRGQVLHWELWNEPDHPHSWAGNMADYCRLILAPGAEAVRAVAPECSVLLGGLADHRNFESVIEAGSLDSFDIASIHHYPATPSVRHVRLAVNQVRALLHGRGQAAKPVWLTECGIATRAPSSPSGFGGVTDEAGQARFLSSLFDTVSADAVFVYQLRDTSIFDAAGRRLKEVHWGLVSSDGARRKSGFEAYKKAAEKPWRRGASVSAYRS
jgi:hypothetical protein